jgi:FkbM family methyltransferase
MLISVKFLTEKLGIEPQGILHVGAHKAEEADHYAINGWSNKNPTIWVEAQPSLALELEKAINQERNRVICAVAWDEDDVYLPFHVTNNGESSSMYELGKHLQKHPQVKTIETLYLKTSKLSSILPKDVFFDFVNLDIQGAELRALIGLEGAISNVKWIYTEVNKIELYKEIPLIGDLDDYLGNLGFTRYMTRWVPFKGWGDALYVTAEELSSKKYPGKTQIKFLEIQLISTIFIQRLIRVVKKICKS